MNEVNEAPYLAFAPAPKSLTGEGHAHDKVVNALEPATRAGSGSEDSKPVSNGHGAIPLAECKNTVFMGTLACGGHAKAVVIATGESVYPALHRMECRCEETRRRMCPASVGSRLGVQDDMFYRAFVFCSSSYQWAKVRVGTSHAVHCSLR